jgi:restriction system protein
MQMFEDATRLWVVHIGNDQRIAERAQAEGFVCIGWKTMGDLASLDTPEKMKAAFERSYPNKSPASVRATYMQLFRFAHEMQPGEPVVYPIKGSRDILLGKIAGPYEWSSDTDLHEQNYRNLRRVKWIKRVPRVTFSQQALRSFGSFSSVTLSDDHLDEFRAVVRGEEVVPLPTAASASPDEDDVTAESEDDAQIAAEEVTQATKDYLIRSWSRTAQDFEHVVAAVFRALGYTATVQQGTRDLGVDVIAHADPLGVTPPILKIQAKSGTSTVGAPAVKQLRGVLNSSEKGILISLGGFSNDARHTEQNDANLILIDSERFVELFLSCYERLSADMRHRFPLQQVYVVTT